MTLPFSKSQIEKIIGKYPTPFHIYDEKGIRETARKFNKAFSWVPGDFKNYFAVKALPNPYILEILKQEEMGADCSSLPELLLADAVGIKGKDIMFTSNDTPAEEYVKARELGAIINLDDITRINFLDKHTGMPELICFRYNPGPLRKGNDIIGDPVEAKYGIREDQIVDAYIRVREKGAKRFGLHTMIVSNMLDEEYLISTGIMLFDIVKRINKETGIKFEFVNLGGGVGIPYAPDDKSIDLEKFSSGIRKAYEEKIIGTDLDPLRVIMECGRAITGPHGWLISKVRHVTHKYRDYVGLDACMTDLARPALYDAYHEITVLGKENWPKDHVYDVTGSLCENNDKFAKQRELPEIIQGDIIAISNTGAHSLAMGSNYNAKLRSAELLHEDFLNKEGYVKLIRRAETSRDYFATLNFKGSKFSL